MNIEKPSIEHSQTGGWHVCVGNYVTHFSAWGDARDFAIRVWDKHAKALSRKHVVCGAIGPYIPDGSRLHCYLPGGHAVADPSHKANPDTGYTEEWT